jgi:N-dimethylarginine dimethylaminohydrolase
MKIKYNECSVYIAGFSDNRLIGATQCPTQYTFKEIKNEGFVDEKYLHISYHFCYVDESTILKQLREQTIENNIKDISITAIHL